jgi:4'-phosphopantetheinyl transferase
MTRGLSELCTWPSAPPERFLQSGVVHVWCAVLDESEHGDAATAVLSDEERARADRFHFNRDRSWFIARRYMARTILGEYLRMRPADVRFTHGPHGKPGVQLKPALKEIEFNLSHSNGLALCAVSRVRRVGIDLEVIRRMSSMDQIAERISSAAELTGFRSLPDTSKEQAFFELWTRKEAFVKAAGVGLSAPLDAATVLFGPHRLKNVQLPFAPPDASNDWSLVRLNLAPEYEAALCVEGPEPDVRCWRFAAERVDAQRTSDS